MQLLGRFPAFLTLGQLIWLGASEPIRRCDPVSPTSIQTASPDTTLPPTTTIPATHLTTTAPSTSSLPDSCTFRPTQTIWATSGCAITCNHEFCIYDAFVTLPCGCPSVRVQPTTTTLCPTQTGCIQCTTGWGIATVTETCPSSTPTSQ
ncbi:hypothetical protein VTK73DRAFT_2028 [Phialemonium thermophilum]|uniref:Uncharacterized protein n=1 Tax=Phialemonium thermophilum TaxID=223376 RepID=A0ABR3X7J6_9PEZI